MSKYLLTKLDEKNSLVAWKDRRYRENPTDAWTEDFREAVKFHYQPDAMRVAEKMEIEDGIMEENTFREIKAIETQEPHIATIYEYYLAIIHNNLENISKYTVLSNGDCYYEKDKIGYMKKDEEKEGDVLIRNINFFSSKVVDSININLIIRNYES